MFAVMEFMQPNANLQNSKVQIGLVILLVVICSITALFTFNIQNKLNSLQSDYNQLEIDYSNLEGKLNSLQSSLNSLENDVMISSSQERISILAVSTLDENSVRLNAESLTGVDVVIADAVIRDSNDYIVAENNNDITPNILPATGKYRTIDVNFQDANLSSGTSYTIALITEKGNSFTSNPFTRTDNATPTPPPQPTIIGR